MLTYRVRECSFIVAGNNSPSRRDHYTTGANKKQRTVRLFVRRTRLTGTHAQLFPIGATTRSSPTPTVTRSTRTRSTATTPSSNSRSVTSKKRRTSSTAHQGTTPRTPAWLACAILAHNLDVERHPRRHQRRPDRVEPRHDANPSDRRRRDTREPLRATHPAAPTQLALGRAVHRHTERRPGVARPLGLIIAPAAGAPQLSTHTLTTRHPRSSASARPEPPPPGPVTKQHKRAAATCVPQVDRWIEA